MGWVKQSVAEIIIQTWGSSLTLYVVHLDTHFNIFLKWHKWKQSWYALSWIKLWLLQMLSHTHLLVLLSVKNQCITSVMYYTQMHSSGPFVQHNAINKARCIYRKCFHKNNSDNIMQLPIIINRHYFLKGFLVLHCLAEIHASAQTLSLPGSSDFLTPVAYFYTRHPIRFIS